MRSFAKVKHFWSNRTENDVLIQSKEPPRPIGARSRNGWTSCTARGCTPSSGVWTRAEAPPAAGTPHARLPATLSSRRTCPRCPRCCLGTRTSAAASTSPRNRSESFACAPATPAHRARLRGRPRAQRPPQPARRPPTSLGRLTNLTPPSVRSARAQLPPRQAQPPPRNPQRQAPACTRNRRLLPTPLARRRSRPNGRANRHPHLPPNRPALSAPRPRRLGRPDSRRL